VPLLVFETDEDIVESLRKQRIEAISGNAADPELTRAANYPAARCLLVAIPDGFEGGQVVEQARAVSTSLPIIARAHSEEEIEHLQRHGASKVIMGEHLIAHAMIEDARAAISPASSASSAAPPATAPIDAAIAQPPPRPERVVAGLLHDGEIARHQRDRQESRHGAHGNCGSSRSKRQAFARARRAACASA
jgi:CPA2 family monovalent cation:H+ antiporter-2